MKDINDLLKGLKENYEKTEPLECYDDLGNYYNSGYNDAIRHIITMIERDYK